MRSPLSVTELLAGSATDNGGAVAVITAGRPWTYTELWEGALRAAAGLRRLGVGTGDTVLIALPNGVEFLLAFFGTQVAGAVAVPVFPRTTPERLASLASLSGAAVVVSDVPGQVTVDELVQARPTEPPVVDEPARPCYIQYTSGTTGDPRGVIISHQSLLANIEQMIEGMSITADDVFVSWLPTYHDMGLTLMALTPLRLGARLVLLPTGLGAIASWLQAIQEHRGTFTGGPDFAFRLSLQMISERERFDLSSLRVAIDGSEPVRPATLSGFEAAFGLSRVMMTGYGLAEATLSVTCTPRGEPIEVDERGLVCLGMPLRGTTIAVLDGERRLGPGQVGELVVGGPSVCSGYHRNPIATSALFAQDGSIRTGDLGYLDDQGRLYFVSRQKDVIKLGGRSLYPQEVEGIVDELPLVRRSAAVGIDSGDIGGEQLFVFAEVRDPDRRTHAELRGVAIGVARTLHETLGVRPRATLLLRAKRIPFTANGKLQRTRVREAYLGGLLLAGRDIVFPDP